MSKIGGGIINNQDGTFTVHRVHDYDPYMAHAASLREAEATTMGESWHVGSVPTAIIYQWAKAAGVDVGDNEAVKEVMMKKLMSGDFSKFRVHEGNV
jgi:hypothetical protein